MKFKPLSIADLILVEPSLHKDERGYFVETFRQDLFEQTLGYKVNFVQDNESYSTKGVLRGLHYQLPPYAQAKLVRVITGTVLDVALDIRRASPSFGQHALVELSAENKHQLYIPHGFAHGYVVLSESATFSYKVDNYYSPEFDRGIAFNDPELNIDWKFSRGALEVSEKDKLHPFLSSAIDIF